MGQAVVQLFFPEGETDILHRNVGKQLPTYIV
jgi:hypothetical protein